MVNANGRSTRYFANLLQALHEERDVLLLCHIDAGNGTPDGIDHRKLEGPLESLDAFLQLCEGGIICERYGRSHEDRICRIIVYVVMELECVDTLHKARSAFPRDDEAVDWPARKLPTMPIRQPVAKVKRPIERHEGLPGAPLSDQEPRASLRDIMFDKLLGGRQSAKVRQCFKPVPTCLTSFLLGVPILSPFFVRLIPFVAGTIDQWRQVRVPGAPVAIRRAGKSDGCIGPSSPDHRGDGASHRGVPLA